MWPNRKRGRVVAIQCRRPEGGGAARWGGGRGRGGAGRRPACRCNGQARPPRGAAAVSSTRPQPPPPVHQGHAQGRWPRSSPWRAALSVEGRALQRGGIPASYQNSNDGGERRRGRHTVTAMDTPSAAAYGSTASPRTYRTGCVQHSVKGVACTTRVHPVRTVHTGHRWAMPGGGGRGQGDRGRGGRPATVRCGRAPHGRGPDAWLPN